MTTVTLPKTMAQYAGGETSVPVDADTLHGALRELTERWTLGTALLQEDGSLQPYLRVVVDDTMVSEGSPEALSAVPVEGRTVELKTAFAGG